MRGLAAFFVAALAVASAFFYQEAGSKPLFIAGEDAGYLPPSACAACHRAISESYRRTAMGRSFYRPTPENTVEDYSRNNQYFHPASGQYYTMIQRGGRYYQRRHELGPGGPRDQCRREGDPVCAGFRHSRAHLPAANCRRTACRSPRRLVRRERRILGDESRLRPPRPLRLSPQDRSGMLLLPQRLPRGRTRNRQPVRASCSCAAPFPRASIASAVTARDAPMCKAPPTEPRPLPCAPPSSTPRGSLRERRLEVCLQCHLESTSRRLPYSLRRYGRAMFSYRPGEPLENYILHFDHAPDGGQDDKFEISGAAYRLMKSACFLKSNQALTCTTCHNPHAEDTRRSRHPAATSEFARVATPHAHRPTENCLSCHMPRRRADDAVHVVMTDHYIQRRRPDRDLLAPLPEMHDSERTSYRGEVVPLYPRHLPPGGESELYLATAQVVGRCQSRCRHSASAPRHRDLPPRSRRILCRTRRRLRQDQPE